MYLDYFGEIEPSLKLRYNYAVIIVDLYSRYPFAYALSSLTAHNVCDALLKMFEVTGIPANMIIASDNGTCFKAALTREFLKRLSVSPRFSTPYHPVSVVERAIGTLKSVVCKLAYDHKNA